MANYQVYVTHKNPTGQWTELYITFDRLDTAFTLSSESKVHVYLSGTRR